MKPWFKVRKAAQVAAYFAAQQGGTINLLKLVKLIYLANRGAMAKYDYPVFDDYLVSMDHGPVNSYVYDYINGVQKERDNWEEFVTGRSGYTVALVKPIDTNDLDELSDADLRVLARIWEDVGHLDQWQLVKYTHEHCPEWEEPNGSSWAIPYARVFRFLGKQHSDELVALIEQRRQIETQLARR